VVAGASLRIEQGNVAQHHPWRSELRQAHLARYGALSQNAPGPRPRLLIWPESAVPYFLDEEPGLRATLGALVAPGGAFVSGVVRRRVDDGTLGAVWNSVMAVDDAGEVIAGYDKAHLVPFGEFMPLRALIPFRKLTEGSLDFSAGPGRVTWRLPGVPAVSPLVCYEAIFPGAVTRPDDRADDRPEWLLNVTNDAWFGASAGPYQHLAAARLRAVEEGLPLVRAANTGISVVTDPYGRVVAGLGLGEDGVIDAVLPAALAAPTLYARAGDLVLLPLAVAILGFLYVCRLMGRRGKDLQP
ncbi:MAG: apolipoprotein N-acyltransferase, partial [Alphaproteobacteria bacterium]